MAAIFNFKPIVYRPYSNSLFYIKMENSNFASRVENGRNKLGIFGTLKLSNGGWGVEKSMPIITYHI